MLYPLPILWLTPYIRGFPLSALLKRLLTLFPLARSLVVVLTGDGPGMFLAEEVFVAGLACVGLGVHRVVPDEIALVILPGLMYKSVVAGQFWHQPASSQASLQESVAKFNYI